MKSKMIPVTLLFFILGCGSGGSSSGSSIEDEVNETAIVDSISTSVDQMKTEISSETENTINEIDSLLSDI